MVYFSKEELCLIEMLSYFNKASEVIYQAIDTNIKKADTNTFSNTMKYQTIKDILHVFNTNSLDKLSGIDEIIDTDYCVSGKEWAQIIELILDNDRINKLVLTDVSPDGKALCFAESAGAADSAIVAFMGTVDSEEWRDNATAARVADSVYQEAAYNYVNGLKYNDITVIGHSKGGNKAMYTAILCDKVTRCVSFDGQGFSRDFLIKYIKEISERSEIITNYSLSTDFVHILLKQLPGSQQYYVKGYGLEAPGIADPREFTLKKFGYIVAQNHSPNSFFKTNNGELVAENKAPVFELTDESETSILLRNYVEYLLDLADGTGFDALVDYVGDILHDIFANNNVFTTVFSDVEQLGKVVGYTLNYITTKNLKTNDALDLLSGLGLNQFPILDFILDVIKAYNNIQDVISIKDAINNTLGNIIDPVTNNPIAKWLKHKIGETIEDDFEATKKAAWSIIVSKFGGIIPESILPEDEFYKLCDLINSAYDAANQAMPVHDIDLVYYEYNDELLNANNNYNDILNFIMSYDSYSSEEIYDILMSNKSDYVDMTIDSYNHNFIFAQIMGGKDQATDYIENNSDEIKDFLYNKFFNIDSTDTALIASKNENTVLYSGNENSVIWGSAKDDTFAGGKGNDILYGNSGNDHIYGSYGNDIIYGGEGEDYIYGGADNDKLYGNNDDDHIYGGSGNDTIEGGSGADRIYGDSGEDIIDGGPGNDWIYGGEDNDNIETGGGDDHVWGEGGNDQITAAGGEHNYLYGGKGFDTISGSVGIDHIYGEDDDDTIDGSFGNDILFGGNENDTLDGGYGDDELYGGNGNDTYIITKNRQKNTILDTYGHNYLDFRKVSLEEVEFAFSEETEDALDIKIKNTNDVFTIKKFSESVEKFSLVFHDESNPNKLSYYKFINNDGTIDVELQESNWGVASHINDNDTLWNKVQNDSKNNNAKKYEEAEKKQPPRDPLVIDFSENETTSDEGLVNADDGVYFDLDNNGFAEKTAWINENKGFLAYDRNGNGIIDNGSELFGDSIILSDGRKSEHGFEALADFDSDKDGDIDKDDAKFKELLVWKDTEKNGRTDAGELHTLEELGIESISLTTENRNHTTDSGTIITDSAVVKRKDGKMLEIAEHWFEAHSYDTQELNIEGDGVSLTSFGIMPSLTNALAADESGELASLVEDFKKSDDFAEKRIITKKILYFITGANEIASDSRGGTVDARDLHVIEAIMGIDSFIGADGSATPNSNAAPILKELYVQFENLYLSLLDNELDGTGYIEYLEEVIDENNNIVIDPEYIDITIENAAMLGKNVEKIVFSIGSYLKTYDKACGTNCFGAFKERYPEYADTLDTIINADSVLGTSNDDLLDGTNTSEIFWGDSGNDTISAGAGNDFIYGGAGNDVLNGGSGNDTYFFAKNHGNDIVNDRAGETKLVFTDGASAEDYDTGISVSENQIGFTLTNKQTGDTIFLPDFISLHDSYKIAFADNESTIGGGDAQETINGTDGNDYLEAGDGFNIFYGGDGEDTIAGGANIDIMYGGENDDTLLGRNSTNIMYGEGGNDKIYDGDDSSYLSGGEGNDELYGGGGADVLNGGSGNDYLQGDHGNDTYIFAEGYDVDTIAASSDLNKIIIHDYRVSDMNNTREANNDLVINFGTDTGDSLIVKAFFDYNSNRDYNFIFDDGTVLGQYDITAKSAPIFGTDGDDYLMGTNDDDTIDGGAGDDNLCGSGGEDTYIFGKGYAHDAINEWGSDHSVVELKDIASDEITVSDQWGSNLLIAVNDTEDVLTISNFKWGQASYTFRFADGAEGYIDKDTWQLILTKQPDPVEEDIEQTNAELLNEIYSDDELGADIFENDSTIISEVTDSITVSEDTDEVSDMTDIQTMILAENMSAFSDASNVYDNAGITDITADTTALDQLLVSSSVQ